MLKGIQFIVHDHVFVDVAVVFAKITYICTDNGTKCYLIVVSYNKESCKKPN